MKLSPDALEVATFEAAAADPGRGTVQARELVPTNPQCSAVDACLTRICDTLAC